MKAVYVMVRPYLWEFMDLITDLYEVVFFTHEDEDFANAVIDQIDPDKWVAARLYKDSCISQNDVYVKDLRLLGWDFSKLFQIDNTEDNVPLFPDNTIPIKKW